MNTAILAAEIAALVPQMSLDSCRENNAGLIQRMIERAMRNQFAKPHKTCLDKAGIILATVSNHYGIPLERLADKTSERKTVWAKQVAVTLIAEFVDGWLHKDIARAFQCHLNTVQNAINTVADRCEVYPQTAREFEELKREVEARL